MAGRAFRVEGSAIGIEPRRQKTPPRLFAKTKITEEILMGRDIPNLLGRKPLPAVGADDLFDKDRSSWGVHTESALWGLELCR